ncbi:MAG: hypothetical protein IJB31_08140, partial [Akkermansia sp.]|nr:hypothetical protein [Akkermansia sp.]
SQSEHISLGAPAPNFTFGRAVREPKISRAVHRTPAKRLRSCKERENRSPTIFSGCVLHEKCLPAGLRAKYGVPPREIAKQAWLRGRERALVYGGEK